MKAKFIVFFIVFITMLISYTNHENTNIILEKEEINDEKESIMVSFNYNEEIKNIDLEEYIIGVVSCEMPASFENEALKAMAVAARTYALYKLESNKDTILSSTTSDQCYSGTEKLKNNWKSNYEKYYDKIKNAVNDTKGMYISYNDKPIYAAYFSISNGYTENSEDVFVSELSYLRSVTSYWDEDYSYKETTIEMSVQDFLNKLNINEFKINNIDISRGKHNRVDYITINNKKYKGTKFRSLLSLRSTDFEIKEDNNKVIIKTKGYGHGIGMSQYGANGMAKEGYTYEEIINHYYTGVKLMNK